MTNRTTDLRDEFLEDLDASAELMLLFEHLPDVHFFVKDRESNIVASNRLFARRMGFESEAELIGKSTWEICPRELAELYVADDRQVMDTGKQLVDVSELNQAADGSMSWFITTKIPLHCKDGTVVGIAGIARDVKKAKFAFEPYDQFAAAFDYIAEHYGERITIPELAKLTGMSQSRFERHFKRLFGMSPNQYLIQYRIKRACRQLAYSSKSIAEVASENGFYDQSAMTRHFSNHLHTTPRAYRVRTREG